MKTQRQEAVPLRAHGDSIGPDSEACALGPRVTVLGETLTEAAHPGQPPQQSFA